MVFAEEPTTRLSGAALGPLPKWCDFVEFGVTTLASCAVLLYRQNRAGVGGSERLERITAQRVRNYDSTTPVVDLDHGGRCVGGGVVEGGDVLLGRKERTSPPLT